jgi:trimethylamine--corrinoid protein Co-methyltransferase
VEYVKLCDGLENISYLATAFSTDDIEPHVSDVWRLYMSLIHSKQPIVSGAFSEKGVPPMCEMMQLFRADRADLIRHPMSIFTITPTGKFCYSEESCQNLLDCVEAGIPVEIVPVTLMGMIAPVSLVGALVFHCVDVLAGITMAQIIRPGAPVLFGGAPAAFNMKTTAAPMSAVEALHHDVAFIAIAKHLGLPAQAYMALSDAKFLDAQAGAETFGSALLAGLAGCNSVSGPGMLDFVLTFSLVKLVFDNEMCAQVKHFLREIKPKEDLPAIDMAREVLESGHLITSNHTLEHWPQELYLNDPIIDRDDRDAWAMGGSKTLLERGVEEVEQRLAKYEPIETDASLDAEMRRIVRAGMAEDGELPPLT